MFKGVGLVAERVIPMRVGEIVEVASSTVGMINRMGEQAGRPNGVTVEFGLKISASGNVIVAGAAGEATLQVALSYGPPPSG